MRLLKACGPPVEMPSTTMSTAAAFDAGARRAWRRACRQPGPRDGAVAAAFTFSTRSLGDLEQPLGRERRRLLDEVDRTGVERLQHQLAGLAGDAHDDDRQRAARHLLASRSRPRRDCGMIRSQVTTSGFSSTT